MTHTRCSWPLPASEAKRSSWACLALSTHALKEPRSHPATSRGQAVTMRGARQKFLPKERPPKAMGGRPPKPVVQLQAAYRGSRARAQVSQQQESYRHAWMRYYLRSRDIDAAVAIGYRYESRDPTFSSALAPAAACLQAAVRGRLARKSVYDMQERHRQRWIEFYLEQHDCDKARALGWRPASERAPSCEVVCDPTIAPNRKLARPPPSPTARPARLAALDFLRFIGAVHVAAYHLVTGLSVPRDQLPFGIKWGFSWVTFFFILSGFVLMFSREKQGGRPAAFTFQGGSARAWLWKRLVGAYPLFVLSLLLAKWGSALHTQPLGFWLNLLPMLAMLQAWAPTVHCDDRTFMCTQTAWNEPAWFISCLFFHWLLFPFVFRVLARASAFCCTACIAVLLGLSFWELILWPQLTELSPAELELVGVLAARHPLANMYKFVLGCLLSRLFIACQLMPGTVTEAPTALQLAARYAATPAAVALCLVFSFVDPDTLSCREAVTVSLYSVLIVSLACGADPLARVFSLPVFTWWGKLSYAVYMLHSSVMAFVSNLTSNPDWTRNDESYARAFFPTLLVLSLLAHYGVEVPTIAYYRSPPRLWWHEWCIRRQARGRTHEHQDPPVPLTTVAVHSGGSSALAV